MRFAGATRSMGVARFCNPVSVHRWPDLNVARVECIAALLIEMLFGYVHQLLH